MKEYYEVLFTGDASILLHLKNRKRIDVMKALSMLSKYLGMVEKWREIRVKYGLKWSNGDEDSFNPFIFESFQKILEKCREIIKALPEFRNELKFMTLSGLRPCESIIAITLYHEKGSEYLNRELMVLEHFKYPHLFFRKIKKAFITVVDEGMLVALENSKPITYNLLRKRLERRRINCRLNYFRKLYASFLRERGIHQEIIDLLQGRIQKSIFLRHYYRPDFEKILGEVRGHINGLRELLFSNL